MTKSTYAHNYTYLITNTTNGMKYIGVRSCACLPENDSYMGSSKYLSEAIDNDGSDNFTKEILSDYDTRLDAANEEIRLHNLYDVAVNPEYYNKAKNTSTGFDCTGISKSDETRAKLRLAWETRAPVTEETRRKMSESGKNKPEPTIEARKKISDYMKGRPKSAEHKSKLSDNAKKRPSMSMETRNKLSNLTKGKKWWNNGVITVRRELCPGDNWVLGRVKSK